MLRPSRTWRRRPATRRKAAAAASPPRTARTRRYTAAIATTLSSQALRLHSDQLREASCGWTAPHSAALRGAQGLVCSATLRNVWGPPRPRQGAAPLHPALSANVKARHIARPSTTRCLSSAAASCRHASGLLVVDVDQLAADGLVGAGLARRHVLRRPEDLGDLVRRLEQVLRRLQIDVLLAAGRKLVGVPDLGVQVGVLLKVLRPEVVVPEDVDLLLAELGVVLFRLDVAGQRVDASPSLFRRRVEGGWRQVGDQLVHAQDGEGGDLGRVRVVDAAGDVAVGRDDPGRREAVGEPDERADEAVHSLLPYKAASAKIRMRGLPDRGKAGDTGGTRDMEP